MMERCNDGRASPGVTDIESFYQTRDSLANLHYCEMLSSARAGPRTESWECVDHLFLVRVKF